VGVWEGNYFQAFKTLTARCAKDAQRSQRNYS